MTPRPLDLNFSKLNTIRSIFWIELAKCLNAFDLIVSIDETSINGSIHGAYGWGPKGGTREIASLRLQDKLSIIAAIFSDGHWVLRMSRCNTNSNVFIEFVDELRKFINSKDYYKDKTILLLIDNASYHKTKPVVEKLRWISRLIIFIPPYSPQFNPIELFFAALKAKIRRLRIERALKLSTEAGRQGVVDAINQIKPSIIVGWFTTTFRIINKLIALRTL